MESPSQIFRVSATAKRDPAIERWFADEIEDLRPIAQEWFARMRQCGDDVRESLHDGCPVACVEDAPFAYVDAFSRHVNVGFFNGAMLDDPSGLLVGNGKRMRHVKLHPGQNVNRAALRKLINSAYTDIKTRLAAERSTRAPKDARGM